jgi:hypothetical protein
VTRQKKILGVVTNGIRGIGLGQLENLANGEETAGEVSMLPTTRFSRLFVGRRKVLKSVSCPYSEPSPKIRDFHDATPVKSKHRY